MEPKNKNTLHLAVALCVVALISPIAFCRESMETTKLGGTGNLVWNSPEIDSIAIFAVQKHNLDQNALLKFVRVVKAKEQVVAGKIYYITLEAVDAGQTKTYEAKVWVKPWENFKQLQEFKDADDK